MSNSENKVKKVDSKKMPAHVDPFGREEKAYKCLVLPADSTFCQRPVAKMDPKTPGVTYPDFSDQVDVQKIVDASKDQTGLAYALRQINQGRLMPNQLADNAGVVSDVSNLPDNVNDAFELAGSASAEGKKVADALGISALNEKDLEKIVSQAVEAKFAQAQAQAQSKKDGD